MVRTMYLNNFLEVMEVYLDLGTSPPYMEELFMPILSFHILIYTFREENFMTNGFGKFVAA